MKIQTICQYCSAGCHIVLNVDETTDPVINGINGVINADGFICSRATDGYRFLNNPNRLKEPMLKTRMGFRRITFDEAFLLIEEHIKEVEPDQSAFFAGARLSNEELYLIQKIARAGVGTNNLASFHYLGRGTGYLHNTKSNIPISEIIDTQTIYLIGDSLPTTNPYFWSKVQQTWREQNVKIVWVSQTGKGIIAGIADETIVVGSLFPFLKLVNRNLIETERADKMFTDEICLDYTPYKENLLSECKEMHLINANTSLAVVDQFVTKLLSPGKAALIFTEEELSGNACREVHNLAMLTGKMGRIADGIIAVKESANSQGLIDMGIHPDYAMGGVSIDDEDFLNKAQMTWGISKLPAKAKSTIEDVFNAHPVNLFIFGEDPVGEAIQDKEQIISYISKAEFSVVQDFSLTPTAQLAELVMPATYLFESGGTYTNSQKIIQQVNSQINSEVEMSGFAQMATIATHIGLNKLETPVDAMFESVLMFPEACSHKRPRFVYSNEDNNNRIFLNGAINNA